jgi:hypothetical protein
LIKRPLIGADGNYSHIQRHRYYESTCFCVKLFFIYFDILAFDHPLMGRKCFRSETTFIRIHYRDPIPLELGNSISTFDDRIIDKLQGLLRYNLYLFDHLKLDSIFLVNTWESCSFNPNIRH